MLMGVVDKAAAAFELVKAPPRVGVAPSASSSSFLVAVEVEVSGGSQAAQRYELRRR